MKAKGLIPKSWDLRSLTEYKKKIIRKREKQYSEVIKHPWKFSSRKYGKKKTEKLRMAGYFGEGDRTLIPNFGDKSARTIVSDRFITTIRTLTNPRDSRRWETITERTYLYSGPELLEQLQKRFKGKLPPGEYWALKVGDNNSFINARYKTLYELMHYAGPLALQWEEQDNNSDEEDNPAHYARTHVHLVKFRFENGKDYEQKPYDPSNPADPSNFKKRGKWSNKRGK